MSKINPSLAETGTFSRARTTTADGHLVLPHDVILQINSRDLRFGGRAERLGTCAHIIGASVYTCMYALHGARSGSPQWEFVDMLCMYNYVDENYDIIIRYIHTIPHMS